MQAKGRAQAERMLAGARPKRRGKGGHFSIPELPANMLTDPLHVRVAKAAAAYRGLLS